MACRFRQAILILERMLAAPVSIARVSNFQLLARQRITTYERFSAGESSWASFSGRPW
jgi:hypothetical protein